MSVFIYDETELEGLWHALGGAPETGYALRALAIANRAAYLQTYGPGTCPSGPFTVEFPRIEKPRELDRTKRPGGLDWDAKTWAENLLYNCVSNSGLDFAPDAAVKTVLDAATKGGDKMRYRMTRDGVDAGWFQVLTEDPHDLFVASIQRQDGYTPGEWEIEYLHRPDGTVGRMACDLRSGHRWVAQYEPES
jgi:hypothetical protein